MHNNAVYPTSDPPEYSELPPAAGPSAPPYEQTTLLTADDKQTEPGSSPPQSAWGDPTVNQYPPVGHYGQYPPPPPSAGPYGQPMAAPYSQPPYGTPYYSRTPTMPPQQQQQQQVVVVNGGPSQPIIYNQPEQFVGQMILACCVFWCCNCLFGLVAFILAAVASNTAVSDADCARKLGHASYGVSIAGIIVSIITIVIVVAVLVSAANAASSAAASAIDSAASQPSTGCIYLINGSCYKYKKYYGSSVYYHCDSYNRIQNGYCYSNIMFTDTTTKSTTTIMSFP